MLIQWRDPSSRIYWLIDNDWRLRHQKTTSQELGSVVLSLTHSSPDSFMICVPPSSSLSLTSPPVLEKASLTGGSQTPCVQHISVEPSVSRVGHRLSVNPLFHQKLFSEPWEEWWHRPSRCIHFNKCAAQPLPRSRASDCLPVDIRKHQKSQSGENLD